MNNGDFTKKTSQANGFVIAENLSAIERLYGAITGQFIGEIPSIEIYAEKRLRIGSLYAITRKDIINNDLEILRERIFTQILILF